MKLKYCSFILLLFCASNSFAQKSAEAKKLFDQAKVDTSAVHDSLGALHFYQAAKEELKTPQPDYDFAPIVLLMLQK